MLEAREHVSDHWRQGKCQLWADGFMCRRPASNEGPRISGNAPTHCFVERTYCTAMTHSSKWDGSSRMVSHIRYWEAHGKSTDGWRMEFDIISVLKRACDWWHTQYPIQEKRNVQKVINIHVKKCISDKMSVWITPLSVVKNTNLSHSMWYTVIKLWIHQVKDAWIMAVWPYVKNK